MNIQTQITDLLTRLASQLQTKEIRSPNISGNEVFLGGDEACRSTVSSLNKSLNLSKRSGVLDAALSLMCYQAPEISNITTKYLVETLVSVLSSTISCKALSRTPKLKEFGSDPDENEARRAGASNPTRNCYKHQLFNEDEFLQIGSSIPSDDCPKLVEACADVLKNLEGHGTMYYKLLHAVLRVATSVSCYKNQYPLSSIVYEKTKENGNTSISKLHAFLAEEPPEENHNALLRVLIWYLDPLTMKDDISRILEEVTQRPFLCLKKELHEKKTWRSMIISLVTSPIMFVETRALLHNWFLVTGLAAILDFRIELVSSVLDVLARPTWWGISMEMGLKLPFSHAYFPGELHQLLTILAGPISHENLVNLAHIITELDAQAEGKSNAISGLHSNGNFKLTRTKLMTVDHSSAWSMLLDFPTWFHFAATLLFCGKKSENEFLSKCAPREVETKELCNSDLFNAAAKYLAWVLSPIEANHSDLLVAHLTKTARSWTMKHSEVNTFRSQFCASILKRTDCLEKKSKKLKICDDIDKKFHMATGIEPWLKDFHDFVNNVEAQIGNEGPGLLFRRIPLGIFIGCSSSLDEKGCKLLLHYAATGSIPESMRNYNAAKTDPKHIYGGVHADEIYERMWAVAGSSLVFNLCDIVEDMSETMFEDKDSRLDFVCKIKAKASGFLVNCIERLIQLQCEREGELKMLTDLHGRFLRWMKQGRDVFDGCEGYESVIGTLTSKINIFSKDKQREGDFRGQPK